MENEADADAERRGNKRRRLELTNQRHNGPDEQWESIPGFGKASHLMCLPAVNAKLAFYDDFSTWIAPPAHTLVGSSLDKRNGMHNGVVSIIYPFSFRHVMVTYPCP